MSAANAFARPSAAYLIADTASYFDDGTVADTKEGKVVASSALRLGIAFSGRTTWDVTEYTAEWLSKKRDQVQAIRSLPDLLRDLEAQDAKAWADGGELVAGPIPSGLRATVALWDLSINEARCSIISTRADLGPATPPYTVRSLRSLFSPPLRDDPWPGNAFDPETESERLAFLQRRTPDPRGIYRVGGAFERYRIHAGGIDRDVVCRWPDKLGQKILRPDSLPDFVRRVFVATGLANA